MFRPSMTRTLRDMLLGPFGVHPHRCYMCRVRFYLFKPNHMRGFLLVLDRPLGAFQKNSLGSLDTAAEAGRETRW